MSGMYRARDIHVLAVLVLVASCDLETGPEPPTHKALVAALDARERDAVALYEELAARLAARGVTLEEAEAAAATGDDEVVRKLFGFTPEEMEEAHARLASLNERSSDGDRRGGGRPGPAPGDAPPEHERFMRCDMFWLSACVTKGATDYARFGKVGLVMFTIWGVGCVTQTCRLDGGGWLQVP